MRREFFGEVCYIALGSLARFRIFIRHHNILFSVGRATVGYSDPKGDRVSVYTWSWI
jgi:hypothetical protein